MPPAVFESAIPARERPQIHFLDRAETGIGTYIGIYVNKPSHTTETYFQFIDVLKWRESYTWSQGQEYP